ncbi:hypothetical protein GCM10008014_21630 [Paenibacillus silvae]|uniref:DNA-binding protein n=1 Tax=Paenibacillus silvae TaxID=1325358 RepID=A0ABQ1Z8E5_9BACL|nr:hypothetical protein [Paenibacillus silvae]GGH53667.1 hypothetical protein GCM10008014_21630 [Paenibacillus silvae]
MSSKLHYHGELDSAIKLLRIAYGFENWLEVLRLSEDLYEDALQAYNMQMISLDAILHTKRSIIYYVGYALLMQGIAYQKLSEFDKSRERVLKYADWGWVVNPDEETKTEIEFYANTSKLNLIVLELLQGNGDRIEEYISFIQANVEETTAGLLTLLEANRINGLQVHGYHHMFDEHASERTRQSIKSEDMPSYLKYIYEYTLYKIRTSDQETAINNLLYCLAIASKISYDKSSIKYVTLFEQLRDYATVSQVEKYKSILEGI